MAFGGGAEQFGHVSSKIPNRESCCFPIELLGIASQVADGMSEELRATGVVMIDRNGASLDGCLDDVSDANVFQLKVADGPPV